MTDHVPTLETCQKLKESGFPQETIFQWANFYRDYEYEDLNIPTIGFWGNESFNLVRMSYGADSLMHDALKEDGEAISYAAPLLTEILEQLPDWLDWSLHPDEGFYSFFTSIEDNIPRVDHVNPAEAAALLCLKLKEASDNAEGGV